MRLLLSFALAAVSLPALAQAPKSPADLKALIDQSGTLVSEIDDVKKKMGDADRRGMALFEEKRVHDAQPCQYSEGHPETCAAYDAEARDIDKRSKALLTEFDEYEKALETKTAAFKALLTRISTAKLAKKFKSWLETDITPCTSIEDPSTANACLTTAWQKRP